MIEIVIPKSRRYDLRSGRMVPASSADGQAYWLHWMGRKIEEIPGATAVSVPADVMDQLLEHGEAHWTPYDEDIDYLIKIEG